MAPAQFSINPAGTSQTEPESKNNKTGNNNPCYINEDDAKGHEVDVDAKNLANYKLNLFLENVKVELEKHEHEQSQSRRGSQFQPENGKNALSKPKGWRNYLGIMFTLFWSSMLAFSVMFVKMLRKYHPFSVTLWRFQGALWPAIPVAIYYRCVKKEMIFDEIFPISKPGNGKTLMFLIFRSFGSVGSATCIFYSLQFISLADSSVISFSTSVFVSIASHIFLGEKSGFIPILCGVVTMGGVAVITRPPLLTGGDEFDTETLIGTGLALISIAGSVAIYIFLRCIRHVHFATISLCVGLVGTVSCILLSAFVTGFKHDTIFGPMPFELPEDGSDWLKALGLVVATFLQQIATTLSLKYEEAALVSLVGTSSVLFAYLWQLIFLGMMPDIYSVIGGGIVIGGVLIGGLRKVLGDLPEDSPTRRRFWILLK